jgi:Rho family protein
VCLQEVTFLRYNFKLEKKKKKTLAYLPELQKTYEPTVFENYVKDITIGDQTIQLSLWDTAGQEEFDRIRLLSYADTHLYVLCFSVENRDSLENVREKWLEEITDHSPCAKIILVALKCDLREERQDCISYQEVCFIHVLIRLVIK